MDVVANSNNNKAMKHRRVHFTRSSKSLNHKHHHHHHINHQKNHKLIRSNSLKNSFKNNLNNKSVKNINTVQNILNNNAANCSCEVWFGDFTREVYNAICVRLGDTLHIPEDSVQALFNDMQLYPSKTQVSKMLQCARQCGRRNGATNYITYGEFCVFANEMRNQHPKVQRKTNNQPKTVNNKCLSNKCDVFLGGSCNPTTWRTDTAIPELKKQGITFYNPQVSAWAPELVAQEYDAKQKASVLLFVLDSETRSTVGMVEVAYLVAAGRCVVLVAQPYAPQQTIMGEAVTDREYRDLVDAQNTLLDLVRAEDIKIHSNLSTALQCTANILRDNTNNGINCEDQITQKLRKLREVYESYREMKFYQVLEAYETLTNKSLDINKLYNYLGNKTNNDTNSRVSFENFCAMIAELSSADGCNGTGYPTADVWASQPFQRQCSTNNNSCHNSTDRNPSLPQTDNANYHQPRYDIFLGGSTNSPGSWRGSLAVPLIEKHGLVYYNPAIRENAERNVTEWKRAIDASKVLLMVITDDARSMTSLILAGYYMGLGKEMVLCVQNMPLEGCRIGNETLSKIAVKDYNRARVYLTDLATRRHVPVFENITEAVECAIEKCKSR